MFQLRMFYSQHRLIKHNRSFLIISLNHSHLGFVTDRDVNMKLKLPQSGFHHSYEDRLMVKDLRK
jgi:hypothetical protein